MRHLTTILSRSGSRSSARAWLLGPSLFLVLVSVGCDRIEALKNQLLGSSTAGTATDPDVDAIRTLFESGQYEATLARIAAVTQANPNHAEAYYYKGLCHLARAGEVSDPAQPLSEEEQSSLDAFQRALSINPRHAASSVGIGDLYGRRHLARRRRGANTGGDDPFVLASEAYQRAITIDPTLPDAQHHYAIFLERTGQLPEAEVAYKAAVEAAAVVPEVAPDYYMAYGRFLAGPADRLDEALVQFELAQMFRENDSSIKEQMAIVHSRLGVRHLERQEYLLAEEALTKAQNLFPDPSVPDALKAAKAMAELRSIRRR